MIIDWTKPLITDHPYITKVKYMGEMEHPYAPHVVAVSSSKCSHDVLFSFRNDGFSYGTYNGQYIIVENPMTEIKPFTFYKTRCGLKAFTAGGVRSGGDIITFFMDGHRDIFSCYKEGVYAGLTRSDKETPQDLVEEWPSDN